MNEWFKKLLASFKEKWAKWTAVQKGILIGIIVVVIVAIILMLDDRAIQKVLREVDQQELAKALKSVDTEVQDKIFRNMSKRAASMLKEDMEFMGPVRLKDVEESQQKIVSTIRRLEDSGEIVIARSGEDELVV